MAIESVRDAMRVRDEVYSSHLRNYRIGGMSLNEIREEFSVSMDQSPSIDDIVAASTRLVSLSAEAFSRLRQAQSARDTHSALLRRRRAGALRECLESYGDILRRLPSSEQSELIDSYVIDDIVIREVLTADVRFWQTVVDELDRIGWRLRDLTIAATSMMKKDSLPASEESDGEYRRYFGKR